MAWTKKNTEMPKSVMGAQKSRNVDTYTRFSKKILKVILGFPKKYVLDQKKKRSRDAQNSESYTRSFEKSKF